MHERVKAVILEIDGLNKYVDVVVATAENVYQALRGRTRVLSVALQLLRVVKVIRASTLGNQKHVPSIHSFQLVFLNCK